MSQDTCEFYNCRGEKVVFPVTATLEDLVKAGVDEIRLVPKDAPMETDPKWYSDVCHPSADPKDQESSMPSTSSGASPTPAPDVF